MSETFALDPRLAADCCTVGDLPLCRLLLMNDARFPWLILVPRQAGRVEVSDLPTADQARLWQESLRVGDALKTLYQADKLNLATLGNQVAQLHMHVIARRRGDAAWPGPVWGQGPAQAYAQVEAELSKLRQALDLPPVDPRLN